MPDIASLTVRVRFPEWFDRLVVWCETWGEFLPETARSELADICRDGLKVEFPETGGSA